VLKLEDLAGHLSGELASRYGGDAPPPIYRGGVPDDVGRYPPPDALYALVGTTGLGLTVEESFDRPGFQVLTRAGGEIEARDLAHLMDSLIIDAPTPLEIGGYRVIDLTRFGGGPSSVGTDDKRRIYYSSNYTAEVQREVVNKPVNHLLQKGRDERTS
jgi:hypothetical protein